MSTPQPYFIGLMSGTSTDGVDGVLVSFETPSRPAILAFCSLDMPTSLRETFLRLNHASENELELACLASQELAKLYATCCHALLEQAQLNAGDIIAIGAHGQTVRHRPDLGFTLQLNAPALLAELTKIDVIADFRSRDIAAGGQGAPFAPLLHQALFKEDQSHRVILNLGGIANITVLSPQCPLLGFDTGPANALMDEWIYRHLGRHYDKDGTWGKSGKISPALLAAFLSDDYFQRPAPKSTGRDHFNATWLNQHLSAFPDLAPEDVMASLRALTTHSITQAIKRYQPNTDEIIACGGGVHNQALMAELADLMQCPVRPIDYYGIDSQAVEALAFAWLAHAFHHRIPLDFPLLTGSRHASVAGALYPH